MDTRGGSVYRSLVPVVVVVGKNRVKTLAMVDGGSTKDVISSQLVHELNIPTTTREIRLSTITGETVSDFRVAKFSVESLDGTCNLDVEAAMVSEVLRSVPDKQPTNEEIAAYPHLREVHIDVLPNSSVDVLLSINHAWTMETGRTIRGPKNTPFAKLSAFGWCVMGPKGSRDAALDATSVFCVSEDDEDLRGIIERYFRRDFFQEEGSEDLCPSEEDQSAVAQVRDGIMFDETSGHYSSKIPFRMSREETAKILAARNYDDIAKKRAFNMVKKMEREPERKAGTLKSIQDFFDNGYAVRADSLPPPAPDTICCTLPLHVDNRKPGKWRVCHDAAQKVEGVCLNDLILPGPDLMNDHIKVLLNFRRHPYCAQADIKGFFYQIGVDKHDNRCFQFWWFEDDDLTKPCLFSFIVFIFGAKCSPMVCTYVLRHHAKINASAFGPEVVDAILNSFYVDDFLRSFPTKEEARAMYVNLTAALKKGGFDLVKWKANHPDILGSKPLPGEDIIALQDSKDVASLDKILGVLYSFSTDCFQFKSISVRWDEVVETRRRLLSMVAAVYDPLGLWAPFTLLGRIQFQKAVKEVDGWDSLLPKDIFRSFDEWRLSIPKLGKYSIPRWVATFSTTDSIPEIHVFSDASLEGYGTAIYRVSPSNDGGDAHVCLIFCRNRVVPLNAKTSGHHNSVPRLELAAAVLGAEERRRLLIRMGERVSRVVHWLDSTCVLKQLRSSNIRFKAFVQNRKSRFLAIAPLEEVRYCPTELNPADDCSRGLLPDDPKWDRFHNGPDFLRRGVEAWPKNIVVGEPEGADIFEIHAIEEMGSANEIPFEPLALKYTNDLEHWSAKIRRLAMVVKVCKGLLLWRASGRLRVGGGIQLSLQELRNAETDIVGALQRKHFGPEISLLRRLVIRRHDARRELKDRVSSLTSLNPFLDVDDIIRSGGRLANAVSLSFETKFPVILPRKNEVVDSLIRHVHRGEGHGGVEATHNQLRRRWWILKGRQAVRGVLSRCMPCQRMKKPVAEQKMAPLPVSRVEMDAPAFTVAGIDAFGPYQLKIGKSRASFKIYGLICTCFTSRAIHLEPMEDLSSAAFIRALIRIQARRPALRQLYSDNASNFRAANTELSQAFDLWRQATLEGDRLRPIEWIFNLPYASHRAGIFERCIRSTKDILKMIMQRERISYDAFHTVLVAVEAILNRRPITQVSSDPKDVNALTPSDILYPGMSSPSGVYLFTPGTPTPETLQAAWRIGVQHVNSFNIEWKKRYISSLQERQKWRSTRENLKLNQLVLLVDNQNHRDFWRLGRINEIDMEAAHVRQVGVLLADGKKVKRDRRSLVALEVDE